MKIAMIVRRLNVRGGTQRQAITVAQQLSMRGHEVVIFTFQYDAERTFSVPHAVKVVSFHQGAAAQMRGIWNVASYVRNEFLYPSRLAMQIDDSFDVLNPHDQVSYRVAAVAKKRLGIPSIWVMNDPATRALSRERLRLQGGAAQRTILSRIIDRVIDAYDTHTFIAVQNAIVVLDARDAEWVRRDYHVPVHIVRPGVSIASFPYRARVINAEAPKLLMFSIFFPHRRFEDGIRALRKLHDRGIRATLTIAGAQADQKYADMIEQLVHELALDEFVQCIGAVPEDQLAATYLAHDIFLFPSHMQSWGIAVFEALATGMPVIVSRSAGASEVLTDGVYAVHHDPFDYESIARSVERISADAAFARALGSAGREYVTRDLTPEAQAQALETLFMKYRL